MYSPIKEGKLSKLSNFEQKNLDSRFCMEVRMDSPNKLQKYKSTKSTKKVQKSTKKYISTKVLITQSFLELQTPDFAWKFICTVQPNEKVQKYKKYKSIKSTKVQKYKSTKWQIY